MHRKIWIIVLGILRAVIFMAVALIIGLYALRSQLSVQITLAGERQVTIEYGQVYSEPGAVAEVVGKIWPREPIPVDLKIESFVDDEKLGAYLVKYSADYYGIKGLSYRRVNVADIRAPEIILVSDPDKYTLPNETYVEEGYTATDNHDGDITHLVLRTEEEGVVTYHVADASGNVVTVTRPIVYYDPIPPQIELEGDSEITIVVGEGYKEPGYTATDNCDGDLTKKVSVSGKVDIYRTGSYKLTYTVEDNYKNKTTVTRTVKVKFRPTDNWELPDTVVPNGKVIYLTFDDGPGKHTPELLDILKKYNVKATFFVVKNAYMETVKRAAEEGHTIAMHSASHVFKRIYASEEAYFKDLYSLQDVIRERTGQTATILRFPGGSSNTVSSFNAGIMTRLTKLVEEKGFTYFDWNVDSKDAGGAKTKEEVLRNVIAGIKQNQNSVVLQHDIKKCSIDAVEQIILWGLENGYTFEALTPDSPECHHKIRN